MTVTVTQFQSDFPAFANASQTNIALWLNVAQNLVDYNRWCQFGDVGVELITAHYVSLDMRAAADAVPGTSVGNLASKSVGGVSGSYDTGSSASPGEGHWNLTSYGRRYLDLRDMVGTGGFVL